MREVLSGDPLPVVARWVAESGQPTMTFATADAAGVPHARTVLVTAVDGEGVRFHSSSPTVKTRDIAVQPRVSGVFYWPGRQIVLAGSAAELPEADSRAAFGSRPLGLRRIAWAYAELGVDRELGDGEVERAFAAAGAAAEMPAGWTTIRLVPDRVDFWQGGTDEVAAAKTRFVRVDGGWRHHAALP